MSKPHDRPTSPLLLGCWILLVILFPLSAGCRTCDAVEEQLRLRENDLREARDELCRTHAYNTALQRELSAVRHSGAFKITPELASQTYVLKSIALGRQTGGYDADDAPGDEAIQVVLEPLDPDGHAIKAPGTVLVNALEVTPEGLKKPIDTWQVTPEELRRSWRSGLLATGYFLVLPWKVFPCTEKVRVVVQFTLEDGRLFEADRDITVHLLPPDKRKVPQVEPLTAPPVETPLPFPRKVEGPALEGARNFRWRSTGKNAPAQPAGYWWEVHSSPGPAVQILPPVPR